ncbi:N/A [soil metagenome]
MSWWHGIVLVGGVVAALVTVLVHLLLKPYAARLNLLDHPVGRKDHAHPTPIVGGIAMLFGVLAASALVQPEQQSNFLAFLLAATLLVVVGLLDDFFDLRWYWRISAQVLAALLMIYLGGVRVDHLGVAMGVTAFPLGWMSVPLTVFATVGLINAINMIDGADGLAGTLVLVALVLLTAAAVYSGNSMIAARGEVLIGAVAAFLWYNLRFPWRPHADVFMGNAGSALLGLVIAWMAFRLTQSPAHPVSPVFALWCVSIPVMDTLVLIWRRMRAGRSPFHADRNHIHHLMLDAGYGPTQAAVVLGLFTLACAVGVGQALRMNVPDPLLLGLFGALCVGWLLLTRNRDTAIAFFRATYPRWLLRRPARCWLEAPGRKAEPLGSARARTARPLPDVRD